jgi:hypothetical protein
MCTALMCRPNSTSNCQFSYGTGAIDKTPCGAGKSCNMGECLSDPTAPTGGCIFGDDVVSPAIDLNSIIDFPPTNNCSQPISILLAKKIDPVFWCKSNAFGFSKSCCKTCSGN